VVLTYDANTPMRETASMIPLRDAMRRALALIPRRPAYVLEGMGGFGLDTESIQLRWPGVRHTVWERDTETFIRLGQKCMDIVEKATGSTDIHLYGGDYTGTQDVPPDTLLVLSLNNHSLLPSRLKELEWAFRPAAEWVIYVDFAGGRLHMTYPSYGFKERPTFQEYAERSAEHYGRELLGWEHAYQAFNAIVLGARK
jgi:hypothetical protein